jgi:hypothetical protein
VRAPHGYVQGPTAAAVADAASSQKTTGNRAAKTPETELRDTLADYYPSRSLPTLLSLTYLNTPKNEMLLTSSFQIATNALDYGEDGKQPAAVRIAGVILNDKGKVAGSFKSQLNVNPLNDVGDSSGVIYNERIVLPPGIYQIRVAARDEKSHRVGSALQWIVIPDLTPHQLVTSSILLGAQLVGNKSANDASAQVQWSVDHRFARSSRLGYWIFIYNAKSGSNGAPNLTVRSEVLRNGQSVLNVPTQKIARRGDDADRIAFGEELPLQSLAPGRYDLVVTVKDEINGATTSQQIDFEVH